MNTSDKIERCNNKIEYTIVLNNETGPIIYGSGIVKGWYVCQMEKGHTLPHREGFISWIHPWEKEVILAS